MAAKIENRYCLECRICKTQIGTSATKPIGNSDLCNDNFCFRLYENYKQKDPKEIDEYLFIED